MMGRLTGKIAIVTGGGSGIGRAICQVFAKEGASVAVMDINKEGIEETMLLMQVLDGAKHYAIVADVSSSEQVENAFKKLKHEIQTRNVILVNNAGIALQATYINDMSEKDFDSVIKTNLKGIFLMTKTLLNSLKKDSEANTERGVIVNISSINAKKGLQFYAHYAASKSGIIGFTKSTALEYPQHKVRCNTVLPGLIHTPMSQNVDKQIFDDVLQNVPMSRGGEPEEVAKVCLFLASDESSYVHGACLEVTGGFSL